MLGSRVTTQKGKQATNTNIDIHALTDIFLTPQWGVEIALDRMTQYFHVLEGLPTGWSFNIMAPADKFFPEEITHQAYMGLFWQKKWGQTTANITAGGFYRDMQNLVSYKSTVNLFGINDATWRDEVSLGEGLSKGIEVSGMVQQDRLGATVAYTLSKADRNFANINQDKSFPFKFDRRHMLNAQFKYKVLEGLIKKKFKRQHYLNTVVAFSSGHRATLPVATYQGILPPYWDQRQSGQSFPDQVDENAYHRQEMTTFNAYKMKDYLRLDIAYTIVKHRAKSNRELTFSVFNVLNRHNPYLYFYADKKWQQLSLAPVMPSVRWAIKF